MSPPDARTVSVRPTPGSSQPGPPWPAGARFQPGGLAVAGVAAAALAEEFGTPLLVVDEDDLRARARALASAFPRALYAVKAFTARAVIRAAREEGLGLLVASGGEFGACLRAGAEAGAIAFHGNNKSDADLERAIWSGVGLIVADNPEELRRIDRMAGAAGIRQPVLIRVIPEVAAGTHSFIETGELDSKFGTPIPGGAALEAVRFAERARWLDFRGLHAHVGSQILRAEPHLRAIGVLLDLAAIIRRRVGAAVEVLDLGGGFGATYTDEEPPQVAEVAAAVLEAVREGCESRKLPVPEIVVEPGRAVVANPVLTLYRVGTVKTIPGVRTFVAVDGGMSDNIRPVLYGARYTVAAAGPAGAGDDGETTTATVVGMHCESGDVVVKDVDLPAGLGRGDLLAVAATGAYGYSMASNYNRVGRPAVVGVRDGTARLWLRREAEEELDRLEPV